VLLEHKVQVVQQVLQELAVSQVQQDSLVQPELKVQLEHKVQLVLPALPDQQDLLVQLVQLEHKVQLVLAE